MQLLTRSEVSQVIEGLLGNSFAYIVRWSYIDNPRVLQSIRGRDPFVGVVFKELSDKILGLIADILPLFFIKSELTGEYSLNNLLVSGTIERRVTTQKNVEDNTT